MDIDYEDTAEHIRHMAKALAKTSGMLLTLADKTELRKDYGYAADAMAAVVNTIDALRLDLLVSRPTRELQKALFIEIEKNSPNAKPMRSD